MNRKIICKVVTVLMYPIYLIGFLFGLVARFYQGGTVAADRFIKWL